MNRRTVSALLVAPLGLLILVGFVVPILLSIHKAFDNPEISLALPRTTLALKDWSGTDLSAESLPFKAEPPVSQSSETSPGAPGERISNEPTPVTELLPPEAVFAALVADMAAATDNRAFGALTRRLNFETTGLRSTLTKTRRGAADLAPPFRDSLPALDPAWGDPDLWRVLKLHSSPYTASYLLRALDLRYDQAGAITPVREDEAIFRNLFWRTFAISIIVTLLTAVIGYPTAWYISTLKGRAATIAMMCVLIPFWISILVRSAAWFILLQREGLISGLLQLARMIEPSEALIFTRPAVYLAMVHVLLPFFILPVLGVMQRTPVDYLRASASMGARPWQQFLFIYLPLTLPGVMAGGLIVFMLAVGFYITPALVGGLQDQMIGYYINYFTNTTINQGMAAALSLLLLLFTALIIGATGKLLPSIGRAKG